MRTLARTEHIIEPGDATEPLLDTSHYSKTHWVEYRVLLGPATVTTVRVTNAGRRRVTRVRVQPVA